MSSENIVFGVDWNRVGKKYNWLAVDACGSVYAYVNRPSGHNAVIWHYTDQPITADYVGHYEIPPGEDWTTLTTERPKEKEIVVQTEASVRAETSKSHPHAASMLLYAQDAAVHKEPWKLWELKCLSSKKWFTLDRHPSWSEYHEYRRTPQTVTITIPENVAIDFTSLILVSDAGKAVSVAIQEALNNRYD